MLWLAMSFAAGITVAAYLPFGLGVIFSACVVIGFLALALSKSRYSTWIVLFAFLLAGAAVFLSAEASVRPNRIKTIYDSGKIASGEPVEISGTLVGSIETTPDGLFIKIRIESIRHGTSGQDASGKVRLFALADTPEIFEEYLASSLSAGTRVRISCELERDSYRNPGGLSRKTILDWQDLDATGTVRSPTMIENLGGSSFTASVYAIREKLIEKFRELFNPQVAGVMIASLLGNKYYLDSQTAHVFREGGTFHILVISGLHITFIGGLAALFVGLFTKRKGVQFVLVCTFLWLYTIAVGAEVPVVRASLMFTVLWFSYATYRTSSLANALGTCALVLLVWRPNDLFSPSFQLTFSSVAAIVIAAFPLIEKLREIGTWTPTREQPFPAKVPENLRRFCEMLYWNEAAWQIESARNVWSANLFKSPSVNTQGRRLLQQTAAYIFEGVLVSLIVQAAMLPLVIHYFHRVTPISVILSLWAGVLIALESFSSLIAVIFSYVSDSLALPFVWLTEFVHWLMMSFPGQLTDIGWLGFRVPGYGGSEGWLYAGYFLMIGVLGFASYVWDPFSIKAAEQQPILRNGASITTAVAALIVGFVLIFHPFSEPKPDGRLHVEFLDVGQGDSAFITFPNGDTMLVDGGGRRTFDDDDAFEPDIPSIGEMVVSEFLWQKGYSHIDHLVATHADADHIQGLQAVARNFRIGEAWFGNLKTDDVDHARLTEILGSAGTPIRTVSRGDRFDIGEVSIEVLNPQASDYITTKENDRSIVLRLTYGSRTFLLTGDIERNAERDLADSDLRSDVVKVPHHGSRTSSTVNFIDSVRPGFAIIPVGRRSQFGHPHEEVVERWKAAGASVLTTGDHGTISFSTDGVELETMVFAPE